MDFLIFFSKSVFKAVILLFIVTHIEYDFTDNQILFVIISLAFISVCSSLPYSNETKK